MTVGGLARILLPAQISGFGEQIAGGTLLGGHGVEQPGRAGSRREDAAQALESGSAPASFATRCAELMRSA